MDLIEERIKLMFTNDLELKTKIKISGKEHVFELWTIKQGLITEIKLDDNVYSLDGDEPAFASPDTDNAEQTPETLEKKTEQITTTTKVGTIELTEKTVDHLKKTPNTEIRGKAPNHTTLFLNWLEDWKEPKFAVSDFIKNYSFVSKEQAEKIAEYQVSQGRLEQLSHTRFRIIKRDAENGQKK